MAAGNWIPYTQAVVSTMNGAINWSSSNIRVALLTNSYTPAQNTDATWSNVSSNEVVGTGYTSGGVAANSPSVTSSGGTTTAAGGSVSWTSSTLTVQYAVIVLSTGGASINSTDKILAYVNLNTTGSVSTSNGTLSISGYSVAVTHNVT